ncbi:hypothetical protein PG997_005764 [Apiospora hydei]|uniref:Uncharacterized protein n=1 Tax=Apiospora hydei TaxID=1337664 RepID=A0ABR1WLV6_9PEZI
MYDHENAEAPLGDHCVCHYPDDTTHTWLIHDDDADQDEQETAVAHDETAAKELRDTTTEGGGGSIETTTPPAGSAEGKDDEADAIDIPLRYTAQGDPVKALYCACFVASEAGLEGETETAAAATTTDHLFAGAVVLNQTSGGYDFVQLQSEFGGLTKAAAISMRRGEMRLPLTAATTGDTTATDGIMGTGLEQADARGAVWDGADGRVGARVGVLCGHALGAEDAGYDGAEDGAGASVNSVLLMTSSWIPAAVTDTAVALWDAVTGYREGELTLRSFGVCE